MFNNLNFQTNFRRENSKYYFELACRKKIAILGAKIQKLQKSVKKADNFFPRFFKYLPCWPVFMPQITGEESPLVPETTNESTQTPPLISSVSAGP